MTFRVIFRARALTDIDEAYRWLEDQRLGLGAQFMARLEETEAAISRTPELFQRIRGEIRRALLHQFPYGVFYIVRPEFISVIAVLHHARDPKNWRQRARGSR